MSLQEWQKVFTEKGLDACVKHVKDKDVARWIKGDLSLEDLPEMVDMVLVDAQTRKDFVAGNLMLAAKLNIYATKTQPEVKNEPIVGIGQHEAGYNARPAKRHFGDFPFKGDHWRLRSSQFFFTGQTKYMANGICLPCTDDDVIDKRGESKMFDYVTNFKAPPSKMHSNVFKCTFTSISLCRLSSSALHRQRAHKRHKSC